MITGKIFWTILIVIIIDLFMSLYFGFVEITYNSEKVRLQGNIVTNTSDIIDILRELNSKY